MNMKRMIIRGAVVGVIAGSALMSTGGSAQATAVTCQTMEDRYSDLMNLYRVNDALGVIWAQTDLATANFYYGLGETYYNSAQHYLNMMRIQKC
jgi:hypothetical protein